MAKFWPSYANTFPMKRKLWLCAFSNAKKQNHGLNSLTNVHIYYEDWAKTLMESKNNWSSRDYGNFS